MRTSRVVSYDVPKSFTIKSSEHWLEIQEIISHPFSWSCFVSSWNRHLREFSLHRVSFEVKNYDFWHRGKEQQRHSSPKRIISVDRSQSCDGKRWRHGRIQRQGESGEETERPGEPDQAVCREASSVEPVEVNDRSGLERAQVHQ